jgi:NADPH-dependent curcumin reductase CurA
MPGMTAWVGVTEIAPVREGETIFISAAAGAVGSVAGQIAKARGCRVVGSAGGARKAEYVRDELGFDACFDYRAIDAREALAEVAPDGVDVYFDNVGGPQLEAAIGALNRGGRIALCGAVSEYNATEPSPGPRNLALLVGKRGRLRGFIVGDHAEREGEFRGEVAGLIADGRLKLAETVVEGGLEAAPGAFIDMLRGRYLGKVVVAL